MQNQSDEENLVRGRDAARRRSWEEAFDSFVDAQANGEVFLAADLETWSVASFLLGRLDTALEAMTAAHRAHVDAGRSLDAVRCGFWMSHMLAGRGDIAQAGGWIARCRRLIGEAEPDGRANDYCDLFDSFRLIAVERRFEDGIALAARIVEGNRAGGDPDLYALGLNNTGRAQIRRGSVTAGIQALDEAMVAVVSGELSPAAAGTVYCSLIEACEEVADLARAKEWTEALTEWCGRQRGMVTFTGQCLCHRSMIMRRRGDWAEAEAEARRAADRFGRASAAHMAGRAFYELGEVHRVRGDSSGAEEAYRRARESGHEPQPGLALLRLDQGRVEAAATALDRLLAERTDVVGRLPLLGSHVEVMLEASRIEDADRSAAELEAAVRVFGTSALEAEAERARGAVMLARGDTESAIGKLRRAHDLWIRLDAPYEAARTQTLLSRACRSLGDREAADMELEMARSIFERLGARAELKHISADGGRPTHGLSSRETEVLRLIASGMTNQEIADELHLAVKTVDRHVSNILAKLGVPSRTAATAYAYRNALV